MSKQWGHGFHQGKKAQVMDGLTKKKEYGIDRWIEALRNGECIVRRDWCPDTKRLFMRDGTLMLCDDGRVTKYELSDEDLGLEWFGFFDTDDMDADAIEYDDGAASMTDAEWMATA